MFPGKAISTHSRNAIFNSSKEKEVKVTRDNRDTKDTKGVTDNKEIKDSKDIKDTKESKDVKSDRGTAVKPKHTRRFFGRNYGKPKRGSAAAAAAADMVGVFDFCDYNPDRMYLVRVVEYV